MTTHPTAGAPASNQYGEFRVHYATDKQVDYLRSLFETRRAADAGENLAELNEIYAQVATGKVNKKAASRGITLLLALPENRAVPASAGAPKPGGRMITDKQVGLIERLVREREGADRVVVGEVRDLSVVGASKIIDALFALPKLVTAAPGRDSQFAAGMYVSGDGRIFRAYLGQQSGQILAKEVVKDEHGYELVYRGMAARVIPADARRMTLEEAKAWGKATGTCVKCGRRLDVPESVDAGIGPVCAAKEW
jgi:hypothetical protein